MADKIRINEFEIDYIKNDFEKGIENILDKFGKKLSKPYVEYENSEGLAMHLSYNRETRIDKDLDIHYIRELGFCGEDDGLGLRERFFLFKEGEDGGCIDYYFKLDDNFLEGIADDILIRDIAPKYNGILANQAFKGSSTFAKELGSLPLKLKLPLVVAKSHKRDKDIANLHISREVFLKEINKVLKEYVSPRAYNLI